jgi:O-antigen/teichoic acid export membrane protein
MSNKLKEFAKDSTLYGLGDALGKLGSIILVPILSRIFLPADYGIIDLLNLSYSFLFVTVGLNIYTGLQKFYFLKSEEDRKTLVSSTIVFQLLVSVGIAAMIIIFASDISMIAFGKVNYAREISVLAIALPIDDILEGLMLILRLNRRAFLFSVYSVLRVVLLPLITYVSVVTLRMGLKGVFMAKLLTSAILALLVFTNTRKEFSKRVILREATMLTRFSLPGLPALMILNVMNLLPRYFLAYYSTLTAVGLFGIANRVAQTVEMYKSSFNRAWNPFAFSNAGKSDERYLYETIFRLFATSLIVLSLGLIVFAKEIFMLLTPPEYHSAIPLVAGLCLYYGIRAVTIIYSTGMYAANKVVQTSYLQLIQLGVFVFCSVMIVPVYGAVGIIISMDVSATFFFVVYAVTTKRYFEFNFSGYRLSMLVLGGLLVWLLFGWYFEPGVIDTRSVAGKVLVLMLFVVFAYFIVVGKDERFRIESQLKSLMAGRFQ